MTALFDLLEVKFICEDAVGFFFESLPGLPQLFLSLFFLFLLQVLPSYLSPLGLNVEGGFVVQDFVLNLGLSLLVQLSFLL